MKSMLIAVGFLGATAIAFAQSNGVTVTVGQPSFYGRIDIGNYPSPVVVYPQPVVISPAPVAVPQQPIYLRVPPGHAKKWAKHCAAYNACGQPVYFVQENWYQNVYGQSTDKRRDYEEDNNGEHGDRKGGGKHKQKDKGKDKHKGGGKD